MQVGQAASPPVSPAEAEVACAIDCCDKKEYKLLDNRGGKNTCQRLSHRKHSCVVHRLREHDKRGRLTKKNKFPNVEALPRFKVANIPRILIPDTVVDGTKIIDAKFPCESAAIHKLGFTKGSGTRAYPSDGRLGGEMTTPKESSDYTKIKPRKKIECMTPADAKAKKGANCTC